MSKTWNLANKILCECRAREWQENDKSPEQSWLTPTTLIQNL